jgi:hypothetical protein
MTEARGETYWTSKNPGTCLCIYFPGFLDTEAKQEEEEGKMRKKSKERYKHLHSSILRGAEESATGKSTSCNDNNRYAKESTTGKTNDRPNKAQAKPDASNLSSFKP